MDKSQFDQWIFAGIGLLALLRLLNALLLAALNGLGPIYSKVFANKIREQAPHLGRQLEREREFRLQAELFDKLSLVLLLALSLAVSVRLPGFWLLVSAYLLVFDWALSQYLALHQPESFVLRLYPLFRPFYGLLKPLARLFSWLAQKGERYDLAQEETEEESPEEIDAFIQAGTDEGVIEEKDRHLLENILGLNETVVREIMTPRTEMKCLEIHQSRQEALDLFKSCRFSRIPVFRESIDNIEGMITLKDLLLESQPSAHLGDLLKPLLFIPEGKSAADLIQEMLRSRIQMAVVLDEYGGTAGLITLEDAIEEIVGEIHDEHEQPPPEDFLAEPNGAWLVDGRAHLDEFCARFSLDLDDDDHVDTIGGYLFSREGHIPEVGAKLALKHLEIEIAKADARRIYQLRVLPVSAGGEAQQAP